MRIEDAARDNLARVLDREVAAEDLDPHRSMVEYGLTSLNKVLFLTSLCEESGVDLSHFTEHDVARMSTLADVIDALARHAGTVD